MGSFVVIEDNCTLGNNVLIGNQVTLRPLTKLGDNVMIGHGTVFEGETAVGANTLIHAQCHITKGTIIEEKVQFGAGVITTNDSQMCHLRREVLRYKEEAPIILRGARIGSGAVILPGVVIGSNSVVGAGAVVTREVPARKVVMGVPACVVRDVPEMEWL